MKKKILTYTILIVLLALAGLLYYRFYFVFGEGVSSGQLNYVVKKGYVFKTYEGKLIQAGFGSKLAGAIQSNEFRFSVADSRIAEKLMVNSSKLVELHYKEYKGTLPWRGVSVFVVDSIIAIGDVSGPSGGIQ